MSGRFYNVPPLPAGIVPRAHLVDITLAGLLGGGAEVARHTLIQGAGGFGKTSLAMLVCHDARAVEAFVDGLLWVALGGTPDLARNPG